jgi:SNF family Na+-dependent transporter
MHHYSLSLDAQVPQMDKLFKLRTWVMAANQIFYSLGIGGGAHIAFGSFNDMSHNFLKGVRGDCC